MKLITEHAEFEAVKLLIEGAEGEAKTFHIEGVFMQSNLKNRNGRIYPRETLMREVGRYNKEYVKENRAYGELGHPQGPTINLERVSHMIKELKADGDNVVGRAKILDTPYGQIVKNLMREGAKLGVSSRGMGSLKPQNGANVVQDDYQIATAADIVADPSAPSAFVNGIMENVEYWYDTERKIWVAEQVKGQILRMSAKEVETKKFDLFTKYMDSIL